MRRSHDRKFFIACIIRFLYRYLELYSVLTNNNDNEKYNSEYGEEACVVTKQARQRKHQIDHRDGSDAP